MIPKTINSSNWPWMDRLITSLPVTLIYWRSIRFEVLKFSPHKRLASYSRSAYESRQVEILRIHHAAQQWLDDAA